MENTNNLRLYLESTQFHPTDEELVVHFLKPKIQSTPLPYPLFPEADVSRSDPWTLPGDSHEERYFFSTLETRYPNGKKTNRSTPSGNWKQSGLEKHVFDSQNQHVGSKKILVFYKLNPMSKTDWIMHEYKVANPIQGAQNWVVCKVFMRKRAKKDAVEDVNTGSNVERNIDLNSDGGAPSSSNGVKAADEDEKNNN